jgi:hypothetical protein
MHFADDLMATFENKDETFSNDELTCPSNWQFRSTHFLHHIELDIESCIRSIRGDVQIYFFMWIFLGSAYVGIEWVREKERKRNEMKWKHDDVNQPFQITFATVCSTFQLLLRCQLIVFFYSILSHVIPLIWAFPQQPCYSSHHISEKEIMNLFAKI